MLTLVLVSQVARFIPKIDRYVSHWKPVLNAVPRGFVIGPILFLIYINYLEEGVTSKILKFADDTILFRQNKGYGEMGIHNNCRMILIN